MKRLTLLLALALAVSCQQQNNVVIKGTWEEGAGKTIMLEKLNVNTLIPLDSAEIRNDGSFKFKFELEHPELCLLTNPEGNRINLIPFPGDRIGLEIPGERFTTGYQVSGSEESQKVKSLVLRLEKTKKQLDSLERAIEGIISEDDPRLESLQNDYLEVMKEQRNASVRFIIENLNSLASVYALYQRYSPDQFVLGEIRDLQYMGLVADSVKTDYPGSTLVQSLEKDVKRRKQQYENMKMLSQLSAGKEVEETGSVNLNLPDAGGNPISLHSLKGNVVLVNFWASFNQESMKANENLKGIYEQYHPQGFEVYNVSLDTESAPWLRTIRFEEYPWIDVCDLNGSNGPAPRLYNVQSLPANYLLNREGDVVAKNLYGDILTVWLDNLL